MNNFKAVYKILSALEKMMDLPEANTDLISADSIGVSEERWTKYIEMMLDVGYIKGAHIVNDITGSTGVVFERLQITLKGLEYLQENAIMKRIYNDIKGIKSIIPGM